MEAIPTAGALRFEMLSEGKKGRVAAPHAGEGAREKRSWRRRR